MGATGNLRALRSPALSTASRGVVPKRRRVRRSDVLRSVSLILFLLTFCALIPTYGQAAPGAERVHFGDIVDVDFVGGFEFDWRGGLTIDGDLDGLAEADPQIHALCRTEAEIAADVEKAYSKILKEPKVNVRIVDRSNRALVRLYGAVRTPSRYKLMRPVNLRELLVMSGGLTDDASGEISVFRPKDIGCEATPAAGESVSRSIKIQVQDLIAGKSDADPEILSGDVVTVERAPAIYVIGAVNSPRPIYSRSEMTVSHAIASAGGLAKVADGRRVTILRRQGDETRPIEVDLIAAKTDPTKDAVLKPFDIIDVASRGGGKRKLPPQPEQNDRNSTRAELPLRIVD
jgi:polysaccharide export outer membrane protein